MFFIDTTYLTERVGEEQSNLIYRCVKILYELKNNVKSNSYITAKRELIKQYDFTFEESLNDDTVLVDLLMEKNIVVEDVKITIDSLIGFARAGIIAVPKRKG